MELQEIVKNYGGQIKTLLADEKNQQVLLIAGAAYLLSKTSKERNAILAGLAGVVLIPDKTK